MELEYPRVHDTVDVDVAAFDRRAFDLVWDNNMHGPDGILVFCDWLEDDLVTEEI